MSANGKGRFEGWRLLEESDSREQAGRINVEVVEKS